MQPDLEMIAKCVPTQTTHGFDDRVRPTQRQKAKGFHLFDLTRPPLTPVNAPRSMRGFTSGHRQMMRSVMVAGGHQPEEPERLDTGRGARVGAADRPDDLGAIARHL